MAEKSHQQAKVKIKVKSRKKAHFSIGACQTMNCSSSAFPFENRRFSGVKSRRKQPKNTPIA